MKQVIYRKYRPQTFTDVTGQDHIKTTVQNQVSNNSVAHAYLFAGPRGVGKTTIARLIAKAVNCEERKIGDSEPCNQCSSCQDLMSGKSMDIIEIDAASNTGVDNVRENIIDAVRFVPSGNKKKVFIIDEVHMLSTSAFNALLKTIEEPPEHAIFILATTEIHKIPQTIISRCQRFDFRRIGLSEIVEKLDSISQENGVTLSKEVSAWIARLSEGCMRDAESLLGQLLTLDSKEIGIEEASVILPVTSMVTVVDLLKSLVAGDLKESLLIVNNFVDKGGSVKNLIDELLSFVRLVIFSSLSASKQDMYDDKTLDKVKEFSSKISVYDLSRLMDILLEARNKPVFDALEQLPLEIAIITYFEKIGIELREVDGKKNNNSTNEKVDVKEVVISEEIEEKKEVETKKDEIEKLESIQDKSIDTGIENHTKLEKVIEGESSVVNEPLKKTGAMFSIEELKNKWRRCCDVVGTKSIALPLALQSVTPVKIENNVLDLGFELRFHFDTMNTPSNLKILIDSINEVMQSSIEVKPFFINEEKEETVNGLLDAFGGEVVD